MSVKKPIISYIATGGTIAMRRTDASRGPVPSIGGQELLGQVSGLSQAFSVEVEDFSNSPSVNLKPENWIALHRHITSILARQEVAGMIISHGTDTLEETAFFLDLTLNSPKPVVLFGAQRSACDAQSDGPSNLLDALRVAQSKDARNRGVMVVMNHQIAAAWDVSKTHTTALDSFQCGERGFLGTISADNTDQLLFHHAPKARQSIPLLSERLCRVDIIPAYAGADDLMITAAIAAGAKGLVIQALGAGNVNTALYNAIVNAISAGITPVIASRVPRGSVVPIYGYPGGGQTLVNAGAIFANNLSPQKARILLMLLQQSGIPKDQWTDWFAER